MTKGTVVSLVLSFPIAIAREKAVPMLIYALLCVFSLLSAGIVSAGIIAEDKPPIGSIDMRRDSLNDFSLMKEEVKTALSKLSMTKEGDSLSFLTRTSIPNLKRQMDALSQKISQTLKIRKSTRETLTVSEDMQKAKGILASLEQKAGQNAKNASQTLLQELSKTLVTLEEDVQKLHGVSGKMQ
jgi:hypothetical protein